jgi:hypothetical protein
MPRRGHAWFEAHQEDPYLIRVRRRRHRLQNKLHRAERDKRESSRRQQPSRRPLREQIRHAAIFQIMRDELPK